jgi:hypothetical protein
MNGYLRTETENGRQEWVIMEHQGPGRLIDLHTWNHFNNWAGFVNNLTIYMEILPYLDRLWLGEGFDASRVSPGFWLVEMSGLPFGLMSEIQVFRPCHQTRRQSQSPCGLRLAVLAEAEYS